MSEKSCPIYYYIKQDKTSRTHKENYNTYDPTNRAGPGRTALPDQYSYIPDVPADNPMGNGWETDAKLMGK